MSRPRLDLETTYGKLTVVSDLGGLHTLVRCECGKLKWVLRTNLRAGRIKSCGAPSCRVYTAEPGAPRKHETAGPTWLPRDAIPGLYNRCQTPSDIESVAAELEVPIGLITGLLSDIAAHGGVERYLAFLSSIDSVPAKPATKLAPPTVAPGEVVQPATIYRAVH